MQSKQLRTYAVRVNGEEGWIGVGADVDRCRGHGHETPELAKLCALNRQEPRGSNLLVLPLAATHNLPKRAQG